VEVRPRRRGRAAGVGTDRPDVGHEPGQRLELPDVLDRIDEEALLSGAAHVARPQLGGEVGDRDGLRVRLPLERLHHLGELAKQLRLEP
jgi:hypothetical protein